jgi:acetyl-CoA carboxylase biotin carboxylase subunit
MRRLDRALREFAIDGVETTLPLFHRLLANEDFQKADYDIHWLEGFLQSEAEKKTAG